MSDEWKKCRRCLHPKSPAEFRLAKGGRLTTCCTRCLDLKAAQKRNSRAAASAAVEAWRDPTVPAAKAKPGPKPGGSTSALLIEELARAEREREIRLLILRYEAVREIAGPDRTSAYNSLGLALQRHGRQVSDGVREWSWARGMGELTSRLIHRKWRPPEDPHADPKRLARSRGGRPT